MTSSAQPNATQLQHLIDKDAIRDVIYTYCRAVDRRDWELLRSLYLPDSFDDHGPVARCTGDEFAEVMQRRVAQGNRRVSQHVITNVLIEIDGDRAMTESYWRATVGDEGAPLQIAGGRYLDRLERHDDRWLIRHRITVMEWNHEVVVDSSATSTVVGALGEYFETRHDREDLIYRADWPVRSRFIPEL